MKILVSTWGLPAKWGNSTYELDGLTQKTCTTLKLLHGRYDKVVVIALDSVLDSGEKSNIESECTSCFYQNRQEFTQGSYADLVEKVRETISGTLKCIGIENSEVIVLPAAGSPSGNWSFKGDMKDYLSIGMIDLYEHIAKLGNIEEIAIDLTHGINFMPALSFRMTQIISQLSFLNNDNSEGVKFLAYNSDPNTSRYNLKINVVYSETIASVEIPGTMPHNVFRRLEKIDADTASIDRSFNGIVRPIISSVFYPLPLALSYLCGNGFPFNLRAIWENNVAVEGNTVTRKLSLDPVAIQAVLLTDILRARVDHTHSIDNLKAINERIYKRISIVHHDLIGNELDKVGKIIDKCTDGVPITLAEIMEREDHKEPSNPVAQNKMPNKRIMIAHAGLQKEFIMLDNDKKVGYSKSPINMLKDAGMLL